MALSDTGHSSPEREPSALAARGVVRGHVIAAVSLLRERIAEPWTLSSLSDEVHLSRSQLARAFDATVGVSPMAFLRQMRVEQLMQLLRCTDLSVAEAARIVGWTDAAYASRCFHAANGISPTHFRNQHIKPLPFTEASQTRQTSGEDEKEYCSMATIAKGTFDIQMIPGASELAGAVVRSDFRKTFHGDLNARGLGVMLSCGAPSSGRAGYVAMETVRGQLGDRNGSFALQQFGTMYQGKQTLHYKIVPGSGQGGLEGISGVLHLEITPDGLHHYELEYDVTVVAEEAE